MNLRTFLVEIGDWPYYGMIAWELRDMASVLDVGCGSSSPLAKVRKHFYSIGVDIHGPSIVASRERKIHDEYKAGNVLAIDKHFGKKRFDAVIALDLIEHLTKNEGEKLLDAMESIARKKVIVMTPNGFYRQDPYENNPYQVHKSGWTTQDFRARGYKVLGIRGFKMLRGEYATIRFKPWFVWATISALSQYILLRFPTLSHQLVATKNVE